MDVEDGLELEVTGVGVVVGVVAGVVAGGVDELLAPRLSFL
ncbi:MAG: hypothetical protein ACYC1I_06375 [Acidimicrobiales bacterium]